MYEKARSAVRIQAAVPVVLDRGTGTTENFSYAGVYFVSDQSYSLGDCIPFTLVLGATVTDPPMLMECYGCVVRVEPRGRVFGTAATIDSFWITAPGDKKREATA